MNKQKRTEIFSELRRDPNPTTEPNTNPFELLIAVILSAQATDVCQQSNREALSCRRTPEAILELGVDGLSDYIKTIGLYNSKAKTSSRPVVFSRGTRRQPHTRGWKSCRASGARRPMCTEHRVR